MLRKRVLGISGVMVALFGLSYYTTLSINKSESLPYTAFLGLKNTAPNLGDFVQFKRDGYLITKRMVGREGDEIIVEGNSVYIKQFVGEVQPKSSKGEKLTPITSGKIPEGYVFLKGDHPKSFDSRYQEIGLISKGQLTKAIALF